MLNSSFALMADQQYVLEHYQGGKGAVLAAPGAGKTTLISRLIAHWVREQGVPPHKILVLTFTESAAREFEQRTRELLDVLSPMPHFSTIHSFCNRLLRQLHSDYSDRQVASEERRYALLSEVLRGFDLGSGEIDYVRLLADVLLPRFRQQPYPQPLESLEEIEAWSGIQSEHAELLLRLPELLQAYEALLATEQLIDYDMMISETHRLLQAHPRLVQQLRLRYHYILEDEAQDSNPLQADLLELLAGSEGNLLRVGDPNQSIYGFSGADHRSLIAYAREHTFFPMGQSNRSSQPLMALANAFHQAYQAAFPSDVELKPGVKNPEPGWIWVKAYPRLQDELNHLVQACRNLLEQDQSVAVLCRTNLTCQWLSQHLNQARLPAILHYDRSDHFFQSDTVRLLHHILDYLLQPDQHHLLQQVLLQLGISRPVLKTLLDPHVPVEELLGALSEGVLFHPAISTREYQDLMRHAETLLFLLEHLHHPVPDVLEWLAERLLPDAEQRSKLRLLQNLWLQGAPELFQSVEAFRTWLDQAGQRKIRQALIPLEGQESLTEKGQVHILTAHKAKGLEWDGVLMPLFQYGQPFGGGQYEPRLLLQALQSGEPYQAIVDQVAQEEEHEGIRLVYVGLTRARRFLSLTAAAETYRPAGIYQGGISPLFQSLQQIYREHKQTGGS